MSSRQVTIHTDKIKLDQFLKWCGAVETGGEAKSVIQQGAVKVNGVTESRRGRALVPGDIVTVAGSGEYELTGGA